MRMTGTIRQIQLLLVVAAITILSMVDSFHVLAPQKQQQNQFRPSSMLVRLSVTSPSSSITTKLDHPIILFDGVCNFCNTWVDILLRLDTNGVYKLTPLQSKLGKSLLQSIGKEADDISSIVLIETDGRTFYTKSDCVLQVVSQLGQPFQLGMNILKFTVPPMIRDTIYETISENRYNLLGKRDACRSGDPIYFDRFISE